MIRGLLAVAWLAVLLPSAAGAQTADPRDALFFGEADPEDETTAPPSAGRADAAPSADPRDADLFGDGGAASSGDARDADIFGGADTAPSADPRDAAFFGDGGAASSGDARDSDIFGGSDDGTISASAPSDRPVTSDELRDEGRLLSGDEIERRMGMRENKLDVGGSLYLRMNYGASSEGIPETFPLDAPNLLDLYLDARPTDRLRAFVRGRVTHYFLDADQPGVIGEERRGGTRGDLDQLWLKFDIERRLYVTVGRQPIRWGAGRFWNPTDFLNLQRRDPLAVIDERLGVSLLKLHLPVEASGWNFYAIADLENAARPDELGGALRVEKLIGHTEISLSTAARKDGPLRVGGDISFPLAFLDLRAEAALIHGEERPFYRGPIRLNPPVVPEAYSRKSEWIPQAVAGAEVAFAISDEDSISVGTEYFYNGAGYDDTDLYPWLLFTGDFVPLYLGRHYLAAYASAAGPGSWNDTTLIASLLGSLTDGSMLARFDWRVRLLTYLDVNAFMAWHFGSEGELHFALDIPGNPDLDESTLPAGLPPGLAAAAQRGIYRAPPLLDLGLGLSLRF